MGIQNSGVASGVTPNEARGFRMVALAATPTGSTADTTANFATAVPTFLTGPYALATYCTIAVDAVNGTSFTFSRRGLYRFQLQVRFTATGAATVLAAISSGASAAQMAAAPDPTLLPFFAFDSFAFAAAAEGGNANVQGVIPITQTMIATGTTNVIRAHLGDGAGGAPAAAAGIVVASATFECQYIGDVLG